LQWPLVRSVIAVLFLAAVTMTHNIITIHGLEKIPEPYFHFILDAESIIVFLALMWVYRRYTSIIEKRKALEISPDRGLTETLLGFTIGGGLVALQVGLMAILGHYRIESTAPASMLLHAVFTFGMGALLQEFFFRGIVFRNLEEIIGSWGAMAAIAVIFGALHLGNENATLWTSVALMLGDILLTAAYMLTRRLWMVWAVHMGWNFMLDGVFGMPNSGITSLKSWIKPAIEGPTWITGGSFGIEASYLAIALSIVIALVLLRKAIAEGKVVKPSRVRNRAHAI
jgi:membrane protease YdiL (CAAX protease family)